MNKIIEKKAYKSSPKTEVKELVDALNSLGIREMFEAEYIKEHQSCVHEDIYMALIKKYETAANVFICLDALFVWSCTSMGYTYWYLMSILLLGKTSESRHSKRLLLFMKKNKAYDKFMKVMKDKGFLAFMLGKAKNLNMYVSIDDLVCGQMTSYALRHFSNNHGAPTHEVYNSIMKECLFTLNDKFWDDLCIKFIRYGSGGIRPKTEQSYET